MLKRSCLLIGMLLSGGGAYAVDGVSIEYGDGNAADMVRVGAIWNWDKQWLNDGSWLITGFWEASLGRWHGHSANGNNQIITDVGITPVFRFQQEKMSGFAPYAEAAIGFHLISPTFIDAARKFGSSFQFGDHVGLGVRFGDRQRFDLGYRYQHLSNGTIKDPNHGINFRQVHFDYRF